MTINASKSSTLVRKQAIMDGFPTLLHIMPQILAQARRMVTFFEKYHELLDKDGWKHGVTDLWRTSLHIE